MMSNLTHDPEFPYIVMWGDFVAAKFPKTESGKANAETYARETGGKVVDTNPFQKGYYRRGLSGVYSFNGHKWFDVVSGYAEVSPGFNTVGLISLVDAEEES